MRFIWQGWQDLNLRMLESKSSALPLGDTPIKLKWGGRWESNPRPQGPQSRALTNWATPAVLVRLKGFEPLTPGLEGRCSIQLSYRCIRAFLKVGAGDGNRTHAASLEGWNSTIELHPQKTVAFAQRLCIVSKTIFNVKCFMVNKKLFLSSK